MLRYRTDPRNQGPAMSLSAWERQALNSIKDGLAGSDPELAALLSTFTRLASGEEMPAREKIPASSRRALRRIRRARPRRGIHRTGRRLSFQRVALLLWLLTTAALIAIALALSAGDHGATRTATVAGVCPGSGPEHYPADRALFASPVPGDREAVRGGSACHAALRT